MSIKLIFTFLVEILSCSTMTTYSQTISKLNETDNSTVTIIPIFKPRAVSLDLFSIICIIILILLALSFAIVICAPCSEKRPDTNTDNVVVPRNQDHEMEASVE